jgi:hypothetical protein
LNEIWSRDIPVRPWGRERLDNIPPPEIEPVVEKTDKPAKPLKPQE